MSEAFPGQRKGEEVELIFRRHMMTAWRGLVLVGVLGSSGDNSNVAMAR